MIKLTELSKEVRELVDSLKCDLTPFTMKVQDQEDGNVYFIALLPLDTLTTYQTVLGITEDGQDFAWLNTGCLREIDENGNVIVVKIELVTEGGQI